MVRVLNDPAGTEYPIELLPADWRSVYREPFVSDFDYGVYLRNQVSLLDAPDYEFIEFEAETIAEGEASDEDD